MTTTKLLIVIAILATMFGCAVKDNLEKRAEISNLKESITAYNKAEQESVKTITKIREVVKNVKEPCDCYNMPLPDAVIKLLREQ